LQTLHGLHDIGVRLSVDDFGTGYSSLSYLKRLPIHEVKIDKGLVRDLCSNADDLAIVRSVIDLGTNLGLEVVAEGVEDDATTELLQCLGCTLMQGYGLAEPMPAQELPSWLCQYELRVAREDPGAPRPPHDIPATSTNVLRLPDRRVGRPTGKGLPGAREC